MLNENTYTEIEVLEYKIKSRDPDVRKSVILDKTIPISIILEMFQSEIVANKIHILKRDDFPVELLMEITKTCSVPLRKAIASSKRTPVEVLQFLADDSSSKVLMNLASNPNTPEEALVKIYHKVKNDHSSNTRNKLFELAYGHKNFKPSLKEIVKMLMIDIRSHR